MYSRQFVWGYLKKLVVFLLLTALVFSLAGCGGGQATSSKEPIVIGMSGAMTGTDAFLGDMQQKGVQLAVDEINASGGILGRQVKLVSEDDANDPARMGNIGSRFINKDKVDAIIGTTNTGTSMVLGDIAEKSGVPMLVPFSTGDQISQGKKYVFQVDVAASIQAKAMVDYVLKHGYKKIGILYNDNAFGQQARDFEIAELKARNLVPVAVEAVRSGAEDYTAQVMAMKNAGADVILCPVAGADGAQICKNMKQLNYQAQLIGTNALIHESLLQVGKSNVEGVMALDVIDETKPEMKAFLDKFEQKYGMRPQTGYPALAYDAMMILKYAFEQAGGTDKEKVRAALENLTNYSTLSGQKGSTLSWKAGDHRRIDMSAVCVRVVKGGKFVNAES